MHEPMTLSDLREIVADVRDEINSSELHADHTTAASACQLELLAMIERIVAARISKPPDLPDLSGPEFDPYYAFPEVR